MDNREDLTVIDPISIPDVLERPVKVSGVAFARLANGMQCLSHDCLYHNQMEPSGCCFRTIYLIRGTCRYYKKSEDKDIDRMDLPGKTYLDFIYGRYEE